MNPVHVLEVGTGSAVPVAAVAAVPVQRLPQWQTPIASRPVHVLIAGPDGTVNEGLAAALSRIGAHRVRCHRLHTRRRAAHRQRLHQCPR